MIDTPTNDTAAAKLDDEPQEHGQADEDLLADGPDLEGDELDEDVDDDEPGATEGQSVEGWREELRDQRDPGWRLAQLDVGQVDFDGTIVRPDDLTDNGDGNDETEEVIDLNQVLDRVRVAVWRTVRDTVHHEWLRVARRQRQHVRDALEQRDPLLSSPGVQRALAMKGCLYRWSDADVRACFQIPRSTLRTWKETPEWKEEVARLESDREAMRASYLAIANAPIAKGGPTPQNRMAAAEGIARLNRVVVPRYDFGSDAERAAWLESL